MKRRLIFVLVVLFFSSFVLGMEDPIIVKTDPGNAVKIYAWPDGGGRILNVNKGLANAEGVFSTTFFSLNQVSVKFQILVLDSKGEKVRDLSFENTPLDQSILFDCRLAEDCAISFGEELTEEELIVVEVLNETEDVVEEKVSILSRIKIEGAYVTWLYIAGGFLTFAVLFLVVFRFQQFREFLLRLNYFSEEGELLRLERKIKHKDNLMVAFRKRVLRKKRIKRAKSKLKSKRGKLEKMLRRRIRKRSKK